MSVKSYRELAQSSPCVGYRWRTSDFRSIRHNPSSGATASRKSQSRQQRKHSKFCPAHSPSADLTPTPIFPNPHLLEGSVEGNFDDATREQLHGPVWQVVGNHFRQKVADAVSDFNDAHGQNHASCGIGEVLTAAARGAVDTLLIRQGPSCWGQLDIDGNLVCHDSPDQSSLDLLDEAAYETLRNSGDVIVVDEDQYPDCESPCVAKLRYSVEAATAG